MKSLKSLAALLVIGMVAVGCGKKHKNDNSSSKPGPKVEVIKQQPEYGQGFAVIKANSNKDNAKFKCQIITTEGATGQTTQGEWLDCDPKVGYQITMLEGNNYIVNVKAISKGKESGVETFFLTPGGNQAGGFQAQILNKSDVGATYTKKNLLLNLGVVGTSGSINDVQFECKRESEQEFRSCQSTYDFGDLRNGQSYSLAVRASENGTVSGEDFISFMVSLNDLQVQGEDQLRSQTNGVVNVQVLGDLAGKEVICSIDGQTVDCANGSLTLDLGNQANKGSHTLTITLKDMSGQIISTKDIGFCAVECDGLNGGSARQVVNQAPLGRFWTMNIPESMHITEWVNAANYGATVNYFQVMPESDAFFLGNDLCVAVRDGYDEPAQPPFSMIFPSGDSYRYCRRTERADALHFLTENRMAINHAELATNEGSMNGMYGHERIIMNEFSDRINFGDFAHEWNFTRSQFNEFCQYSRKISTPVRVKVVNQFWIGEAYKAYIVSCITPLVGVQMGGIPLPQTRDWQIGAIFVVKDDLPWGCFEAGFEGQHCRGYSNKSVLEVTYMSDRIQSDYNFARTIQQRILKDAGLRAVAP